MQLVLIDQLSPEESYWLQKLRNGNYSAMHLGFPQLRCSTAAYAAESSIWAKRPMSDDSKTSLQASLRRVSAIISRMAE